jgi:DNA mismatch repair ATPase MutS
MLPLSARCTRWRETPLPARKRCGAFGAIIPKELFVGHLKHLKQMAEEHASSFTSVGFTTLFAMLQHELDEDYFARIQQHLKTLKFRNGVLMSAKLGKGNKGTNHLLRTPPEKPSRWIERLFAEKPTSYSFRIADRDESGARALSELQDRGINLVANALAQSTDHILSFFTLLRTELAFYVGCLNLSETLTHMGAPLAFPVPVPADERKHTFQGLYDVCLALTMKRRIAGNAAQADGKDLVIITGANQGGKSTFLRSIGLAQLMMQCGLFVPAESFCANVCEGLFTHFKRKEDATMTSGKLDEELSRMSEIVTHLTANSLVLFNESFAATNEREGAEIARQIISALVEKRIEVFFVTHLYEFAHGVYRQKIGNALFLRAGRQVDGRRTFQLQEGEPLQTSYGEDVYQRVFKNQ